MTVVVREKHVTCLDKDVDAVLRKIMKKNSYRA